MALASGVFLSACSTFGIRSAEEPAYQVIDHVGAVEIRSYGPRIAAETRIAGDEMAARSTGFRRLAGYIFGGNHARASISMTVPVSQATGSQTIAMTAPVDQARQEDGEWRIRFFMPAQYTMETLPAPDDPNVTLVTTPPETLAVLRYSGIPSAAAVQDAERRLVNVLDASVWKKAGAPMAWFYDPPWTLPPLRRNEAVVPVSR